MFTRFRLVVLAMLLGMTWSRVVADPIEWKTSDGGNGHWYELRDGDVTRFVTWERANQIAQSLTFMGAQGHLATLTSNAEWQFILRTFGPDDVNPTGIFLGGYQDTTAPDYSEPAGGWRWVTGEPWSFAAWDGINEPNDNFGPGSENHVEYITRARQWNDNDQPRRFFVEYPVPEPLTIWMLGIGGAGLLALRRRAAA